jgi:hypothetical protein
MQRSAMRPIDRWWYLKRAIAHGQMVCNKANIHTKAIKTESAAHTAMKT